MGYRLGGKCSYVGVVARIEDEVALPSLRDELQFPELTKMLRDRGGRHSNVLREIVDRVFSVKEGPEDSEPGFDRHCL
jgi:hypothetical protein